MVSVAVEFFACLVVIESTPEQLPPAASEFGLESPDASYLEQNALLDSLSGSAVKQR